MSVDVHPYWTNESLSITVQNGDGANRFSFDQPFSLLGRHPDCDLVLEHEGIENRSLVITLAPTEIYGIVLCESAKKAGKVFSLEENRAFKMGRCEIKVGREPMAEQPTIDSRGLEESISVISWKTKSGRMHAQLPNHRPVLLGRRNPAQIVVQDDTVSAVHCCLYRSDAQLWAIDLCSSRGTWRKGESVRVVRLNHGKSFTAGLTRFHFLNLHPDEVVESLASAHVESTQGYEAERANWLRHRSVLLSSLGQLHHGLDQQNLQANEETELLLARIGELESQLVTETSHHDELVAQHGALQREHEALRGQYEAVQMQHERSIGELEDAKQEHVISNSRRAELESQLVAETNRHAEVVAQIEALQHQHEALQAQYERSIGELENARQEHATLNSHRAELESQLVAETNRHAEVVDQIEALQRQNEALQAQHERSIGELESIKQEYATWKTRRVQEQYDLEERARILTSLETNATERELELIAMRTKLRKDQAEFEQLRSKLHTSREVPSLYETFSTVHDGSVIIRDETCISSPNFAQILDEAIESHHPGSDG